MKPKYLDLLRKALKGDKHLESQQSFLEEWARPALEIKTKTFP